MGGCMVGGGRTGGWVERMGYRWLDKRVVDER